MTTTTTTIECPSGFIVTVRGLTLIEVDILDSARKARRVDALDQVLGKCWQETIDSGPYDFQDRPAWGQVIQGDREAVMYGIRTVMYGPEYEFRVQCNIDSCRQTFSHTVNLDELPVQRLSQDDIKRFREGNRFEFELNGYRYVYAMATGEHLRRFEQQMKGRPTHKTLMALASRMVEIHSLSEDRPLSRADVITHLATLPLPAIDDLSDEFARHDCGINTTLLDVECPVCWAEQDINIPFGEGFFSPRTRKRAESRLRQTSATSSGENTSLG